MFEVTNYLTHKEFVCLFVCPRKREAEEKNFIKSLKKKRKKTTFFCRLFTREDCCTTDYHDHASRPPRDRERERDRERDFVVVVAKKKKKKNRQQDLREREAMRERRKRTAR